MLLFRWPLKTYLGGRHSSHEARELSSSFQDGACGDKICDSESMEEMCREFKRARIGANNLLGSRLGDSSRMYRQPRYTTSTGAHDLNESEKSRMWKIIPLSPSTLSLTLTVLVLCRPT